MRKRTVLAGVLDHIPKEWELHEHECFVAYNVILRGGDLFAEWVVSWAMRTPDPLTHLAAMSSIAMLAKTPKDVQREINKYQGAVNERGEGYVIPFETRAKRGKHA